MAPHRFGMLEKNSIIETVQLFIREALEFMAHLCFFGALVFSPILCTYTTFSLRQTGLYFSVPTWKCLMTPSIVARLHLLIYQHAQEEIKNLWSVQGSNPASLFRGQVPYPLSYSISGIGTAETSVGFEIR